MRASLAHAADISATDLDALEHLEADGPLTQRQLGERLSLTSGAITMLVDRLERLGLVRRGPHPTDRRYILLELSPEAVKRAPAGLATYHARMRALAAETRPEHRAALCSFLLAASNAASEAADELSR
jgi:DNA-binding MarR family transcriptional regulator